MALLCMPCQQNNTDYSIGPFRKLISAVKIELIENYGDLLLKFYMLRNLMNRVEVNIHFHPDGPSYMPWAENIGPKTVWLKIIQKHFTA